MKKKQTCRFFDICERGNKTHRSCIEEDVMQKPCYREMQQVIAAFCPGAR